MQQEAEQVHTELVLKMFNLRKEDWKRSHERVKLEIAGKTSAVTLMLRDELKPLAVAKHQINRAPGPGMFTMSTALNSCTCSASPATSGSFEEQFQSRSKRLRAFGGLLLKTSLLRRLLEDPPLRRSLDPES